MYDIVIIGSGPAGLSSAIMLNEQDLRQLWLRKTTLAQVRFQKASV